MTKAELIEKVRIIENNTKQEIKKVKIEYAKSNQKYEVGDILEDHYQKIKVEQIKYGAYSLSNFYEAVCFGSVLKKNNETRKDKSKKGIHQSDVKRKLN